MQTGVKEIVELHRQFWTEEPMDRPIVSFRIAPDFFFSTHFQASRALLSPGMEITPEMIDVDSFLGAYEKEAATIELIGQDAFWAAEPFVGFPWIEAISGCNVIATENSFITQPCLSSVTDYEQVFFDPQNLWFKKYMEFTIKLSNKFKGKYPIGQSITRGISDVIGALIGQMEMVYAFYEHPEEIKQLAARIGDIFIQVIQRQQEIIQPIHGGYSMGFYHLWSPGKCVWFQEDLTSIMSPQLYRKFIKGQHEKICSLFDYSAIHLHSSSFFLLDDILSLAKLKVIEINKDIGGLSVNEMIPVFKKVQANGKKLMIWGDLNKEEIDLIIRNLDIKGIHFNLICPNLYTAKDLLEHIRTRFS